MHRGETPTPTSGPGERWGRLRPAAGLALSQRGALSGDCPGLQSWLCDLGPDTKLSAFPFLFSGSGVLTPSPRGRSAGEQGGVCGAASGPRR